MPAISAPAKVLVSGANGYIAVWVVQTLLEKGYSVRGTVRSADKGKHLQELFGKYGDKFEFVVVEDITKVRSSILPLNDQVPIIDVSRLMVVGIFRRVLSMRRSKMSMRSSIPRAHSTSSSKSQKACFSPVVFAQLVSLQRVIPRAHNSGRKGHCRYSRIHQETRVRSHPDTPDRSLLSTLELTGYGSRKSVKRVVITASCASVLQVGYKIPSRFDESSWNEPAIKDVAENGNKAHPGNIYRASKTLAEKGAFSRSL